MLTRRQFEKLSFLSLIYSLKQCSSLDRSHLSYKSSPTASEASEIFILWERGYLAEETQGILQLSEEWQKISGNKIKLKLVSDDFIEQSLLEFLKNSNTEKPPDIVFSITFNQIIAPVLAWQDKLLDLSDLIQPIESKFYPDVLPQTFYWNQVRGERSYYAIPLGKSDAYLHYWKDSLAKVGYSEADIPRDWNLFWEFWKTAQTELRSHQISDLYGLGLCMSANGFDTSAVFQLFLSAHDVSIIDQDRLVLADSQNRQRFIETITQITDFYRQGYVPPDALEWPGSGNNIAFLNHRVLMTINMTLSIPRSQKFENNKYNQNAAKRYQDMGTLITYPNTLNGKVIQVPRVINQILVLKHRPQSQGVLDFLQYLLQPDNLKRLTHGFNGRIVPTMPSLLNDPLWQNPADPHSRAALTICHQPRPHQQEDLHPVQSQIYVQQLWAQIIHQTLKGNTSPIQAADWGIAQIQQFLENLGHRL